MKTIKKKTFIRSPTFVSALLFILLLSSMIGTTVWAESGKPDKPGKPSPKPEIANYNIWIGEVGQDIILDSPRPLSVENVVGGDWRPPPTKGKSHKDYFWNITLPLEAGYDCGKYTIAPVPGVPPYGELSVILADHGVNDGVVARFFSIGHVHTRARRGEVRDYWQIWIGWEVDPFPDEPSIPHILIIGGRTNIDAEWEGVYEQLTDTDIWSVTFNDAEYGLIGNDESGKMTELWIGQLSFTVTIERTLV